MITAHIFVKANPTDPEYQRILVNDDGEYYHPQLLKWLSLPEDWKIKAKEALKVRE